MSLIVGSLLSSSYMERREHKGVGISSNLKRSSIRIIFYKYGNNVEYLF